ncbi:hypothetical protein BDP27DRAFT_1404765 [Rhodocollybia butyracea]|uniref:Uncharacterized protein n=1 Tax=Rhodocollybia butyracea TaxID=206335 RepID=A0A9P5PPF3_9AGAR|nr:hypothetical protein BDP27DRAFT_1404765 [Rhodocollybia butyracea]
MIVMDPKLESIRGRLYLLTKVAAVIQATKSNRDNNPYTNPYSVKSASSYYTSIEVRQAKLLSHLAVLFSRESDKAVATYAGPVLANRLAVVVASPRGPPTLDEPDVMPELPRFRSSSAEAVAQIPPSKHTELPTRNSADVTNYQRVTVIEEELGAKVESILNNLDDELEYHAYIERAMCILRHTALAVVNQSDTKEVVLRRTLHFFLAQCVPEIMSRFREVEKVYLGEKVGHFKSWTESVQIDLPTCETGPIQKGTYLSIYMMKHVPSTDMGDTVKFTLDSSSFPSWIQMILKLLDFLPFFSTPFDKTLDNLEKLSLVLQLLHEIIDCAPAELWAITKLNDYLKSLRLETKTGNEGEGEDNAEGEQIGDTVGAQTSSSISKPRPLPECSLFFHAIDAICAWTTAVKKLLSYRHLGSQGITLDIHVIDLPQSELAEPTLDSALSVWGLEEHSAKIQGLSKRIHNCSGDIHCEAGLLASLLFPSAPKNNSFDFHSIPRTTLHVIGVAKDCCPVCQHLATVLETTENIKLYLPGNHSRYHAWYPPDSLPSHVLKAVEQQILRYVKQMLEPQQSSCSRASFVSSDDSIRLPFQRPAHLLGGQLRLEID